MDMITVSAKTLDEAITKALIELQTNSDHLYYEVIEKGSSGLFGIFGAKPYVIRARIKLEEEEKSELNNVQVIKEQPELNRKKEAKPQTDKKKYEPHTVAKETDKPKEYKRPEEKKERPERSESKKSEKKERSEFRPVMKADPDLVQNKAKEFLSQIFQAMNIEVNIETVYNEREGELQVTMTGTDMGILIGKRGQTLDSLQYLVSLVVNRETEGYLRVKLDTENYRERRKETLESLAKNIAYKVKRTKRPVSLEPMNPYERRIIHSALQNDKYIVTRSEGEDPYRHVVVSLKRDNYKK